MKPRPALFAFAALLMALAGSALALELEADEAPFVAVPAEVYKIASKFTTSAFERCATEHDNALEGIVSCFEHPKGTSGVLPKLRFLCRGASFADMASRVTVSPENQQVISGAMSDISTYCNNKAECVEQQCRSVRRLVKFVWLHLKVKELEPRQREPNPAAFEALKWEKDTLPGVLTAAHDEAEKKGPAPVQSQSINGEERLGAVADDPAKATAVSKAFTQFRRGTIELCWPSGAPRDVSQMTAAIKTSLLTCYGATKQDLGEWCTMKRKAFAGCYLDLSLLQTAAHAREQSMLSSLVTRRTHHKATDPLPSTDQPAAAAPAAAPAAGGSDGLDAKKQNLHDMKASIQQLCANCECYTNVCRQVGTEMDKLVDTARNMPVK